MKQKESRFPNQDGQNANPPKIAKFYHHQLDPEQTRYKPRLALKRKRGKQLYEITEDDSDIELDRPATPRQRKAVRMEAKSSAFSPIDITMSEPTPPGYKTRFAQKDIPFAQKDIVWDEARERFKKIPRRPNKEPRSAIETVADLLTDSQHHGEYIAYLEKEIKTKDNLLSYMSRSINPDPGSTAGFWQFKIPINTPPDYLPDKMNESEVTTKAIRVAGKSSTKFKSAKLCQVHSQDDSEESMFDIQ